MHSPLLPHYSIPQGIHMTIPKAAKAKLQARKNEFEFNQETLNQKLAFAAQTYYLGLPALGAGTTSHAREFLVFKDLSDLLVTIKADYKLYDTDPQYTRNRDGIFRVCLIKPESLQHKDLELIEADIKRNYKNSLAETKELIIEEILAEVAADKAALEEQKRIDKAKKDEETLRKALSAAA